MKKSVSSVVSIDSGRKHGPAPTMPPGTPTAKRKKGFVLNDHTRRQFLALVFGPLEYGFNRAIEASNHDARDGWEQIVNMGRREWERKIRGIAA